jgi:hypothetical protein
MAFVSDFTKLPQQIVIDLINNDNSTALTPDLLTFGLPTAATGDNPTRNTELSLTAKAGSGYKGSVTVKYNRVDLSTVPGARSVVFPKGDATKIADLIPEINAAYQLNLQPEDFVDGDLPAFAGQPNEQHDFQLAAGADSLCFINSVTLTVHADDIDLASVITTQELNGLVYTQPAA